MQTTSGQQRATNVSEAPVRRRTFRSASPALSSELHVVAVLPHDTDLSHDGLVWLVASALQQSDDPLAQAIVQFARGRGLKLGTPTTFQLLTGGGVRATVDERVVLTGTHGLMRDEGIDLGAAVEAWAVGPGGLGRTVVYVAVDGLSAGSVVVEDRALRLVPADESPWKPA